MVIRPDSPERSRRELVPVDAGSRNEPGVLLRRHATNGALVASVVATAFVLSWMLASGAAGGEAQALGAAVGGTLLCLSLVRPQVGFLAVLVIYFVAVSVLPVESVGVDVRLAASPFALLLLLQARERRTTHEGSAVDRALLLAVGLAAASTAWSASPGTTVESVVALLTLWAIVWAAPRVFSQQAIRTYLLWVLAAITLLSAAAAMFPVGRTGGRISGITGNPNSLALILLLLVPLALARRSTRPIVPLALLLLIGTASRGAGLGVVGASLIVIGGIQRPALRRMLLLMTVLTLAIGARTVLHEEVESRETASASSLVRTENSRQEQWTAALATFARHPLVGTGWDAYTLDPASSYLKVVVEIGLIGVLLLLSVVRHVHKAARQGGTVVAAVALGGLINAAFESWLLVGGSFFAVVYWLVLASAQPYVEET